MRAVVAPARIRRTTLPGCAGMAVGTGCVGDAVTVGNTGVADADGLGCAEGVDTVVDVEVEVAVGGTAVGVAVLVGGAAPPVAITSIAFTIGWLTTPENSMVSAPPVILVVNV